MRKQRINSMFILDIEYIHKSVEITFSKRDNVYCARLPDKRRYVDVSRKKPPDSLYSWPRWRIEAFQLSLLLSGLWGKSLETTLLGAQMEASAHSVVSAVNRHPFSNLGPKMSQKVGVRPLSKMFHRAFTSNFRWVDALSRYIPVFCWAIMFLVTRSLEQNIKIL